MKTTLIYSLLFVFFFSCSSSFKKSVGILNNYNFEKPTQFTLSPKLNEISGLANSSDENLYSLNDEIGIIYKLDSKNGKILKRFFLGKWTVEADFEGIASTNNSIFAITSNGTLYKFNEGENEGTVNYEIIKLPFSSNFNIEGLCFDSDLNGLLIACKEYAGKKYKDHRAIYFYSLDNNELRRDPLFTISLKKLKKEFGIKDFFPSGIAKHPKSGTYFTISAKGENVLLETDNLGNVLGVHKLKEKLHRQPEGITILEDFSIMIGDEAAGKKPTLTRYTFNK